MSNSKKEHDSTGCPVGKFFNDLDRVFNRKSDFFQHLNQSRIEFLKAMQSLIDAGIEHCEKRGDKRDRPKMNSIKVE